MYKSRLTVFVSAFAPVSSINSFTGIPLSFRSSFFSPLISNATSAPFRPRPLGVRWMRSISMKTANGIGENSERGAAVVPADLSLEMSRSYMEYAMSVILRRAMPDVRDGLKPVHRRLLFAMHDLGLNPNGKFRKSARVVGEVLGKYHPHGETAVYDALVRMSQDFSMGIPLINGHGNFGSTDGDPPAAMRYTECKLSALAKTAFFEDLDKDTVEHISNFDGSEIEPLVLPARVPNLLLNGSSGIAVGMATNIPPHNLHELVDALVAMMKNPELTDEELLKLVPGPDFPTGGQILGTQGSQEMHLHGRGRIVLRACVHHEVISNENSSRKATRHAIVVTELPYQVNKANLVQKIADLTNSKKLEGIADLRDESDRSGTRIVIELKRDAVVEVVLNNLYKKTHLMTSFAANIMALDNGRSPVRLSLRNCLEKFLNFRRETVRRGVLFDLRNAEEREHIVGGLLIAQKNVDDVVRTIRNASDSLNAKSQVMKLFEFSERQADSVLSMQLRRLTVLEKGRLEAERAKLLADIAEYRSILADASKVDKLISDELQVMVREYAMPRRSIIIQDGDESGSSIDERSLVANDRSVVVVTQQGYIKRMPIATFGSQKRGTRGKKGLGQLRKNDMVAHFFMCMAHDKLLVIAKNGIAYDLPAHKVPVGSPAARGVPLFQLLPDIEAGQTMASVLPVSDCQKDEHLVLLTQAGLVKKTPLSPFQMLKCSGKMIIRLDPGDELRWVRRCSLEDSVIIASEKGFVIRFLANNSVLRASGRASRGVKSIKLTDGDAIASMDVVRGLDGTRSVDQFILAVTKQGGGKRVGLDRFPPQARGGTGRIGIKFKKGSDDRIVSLSTCFEEDSVMLATRDGTIVRQVLSSIPLQSRFSRGVLLQRLQDNDAVAAVTIFPSEFETGSEVTELPGPIALKEDSDSTDSV